MDALFLTSQRLITQHWPAASALLAPVLDAARGEFTIEDLHDLCREGRAVAGLGFRDGEPVLAFVWELRLFPRRTVANIVALGGSGIADAAATFWPQWLEWCRECGIDEVEACVSPAMARMLRPLGFAQTYSLVRTPC
jgi:hypothetical protein